MLTKLPHDPAVWLDLTLRYQCEVFCGLFLQNDNEGLELEPQVLSMLGSRRLRLGLEIYDCHD